MEAQNLHGAFQLVGPSGRSRDHYQRQGYRSAALPVDIKRRADRVRVRLSDNGTLAVPLEAGTNNVVVVDFLGRPSAARDIEIIQ